MTGRLSGSCFWRRARNWRASISTGRISMSQRWRTCSATRIRILFIELSEGGKGRHPPSRGQSSNDLLTKEGHLELCALSSSRREDRPKKVATRTAGRGSYPHEGDGN